MARMVTNLNINSADLSLPVGWITGRSAQCLSLARGWINKLKKVDGPVSGFEADERYNTLTISRYIILEN